MKKQKSKRPSASRNPVNNIQKRRQAIERYNLTGEKCASG